MFMEGEKRSNTVTPPSPPGYTSVYAQETVAKAFTHKQDKINELFILDTTEYLRRLAVITLVPAAFCKYKTSIRKIFSCIK